MDLLVQLVKTSFKLKYNGSILGMIWVLLKPFMQFLILYVVFSSFGGNSSIENFTIYLLTGLLIFSFIQEGIMTGIHALLDKAHIILKVNFDKTLVIYASFLLALINFLINSIIIGVFIIFNPVHTNILAILYIIFVLIIISLILVGLSFFTSIIAIKIRDLQHIAEVAMQLLFYATPIFYQLEIVPVQYRQILRYNPIYILMEAIRASLIKGDIIFLRSVTFLAIFSVVLFIFGYKYFNHKIKKVAEFF